VTRGQAANFYYGIRLLPAGKRRAMCAVYAFARRVDDIGDGGLEPLEKLRRLDAAALDLVALRATVGGGQALDDGAVLGGEDPVLAALAAARADFGLPLDALDDLIEGVRMDVDGVVYESFDDLVLYCRRVAGSIGRLCVAIFGASERERAAGLADDLGVAMQLTNILRDLREDGENGRLYLPLEDLARFGEDGTIPKMDDTQRAALVRFEARRAREWFDQGMPLVAMLDRRSAACVLAMAGIYSALLDRIDAYPGRVMRERISLPAHAKALIATRSLLKVAR
jgi:phytoene synthase